MRSAPACWLSEVTSPEHPRHRRPSSARTATSMPSFPRVGRSSVDSDLSTWRDTTPDQAPDLPQGLQAYLQDGMALTDPEAPPRLEVPDPIAAPVGLSGPQFFLLGMLATLSIFFFGYGVGFRNFIEGRAQAAAIEERAAEPAPARPCAAAPPVPVCDGGEVGHAA